MEVVPRESLRGHVGSSLLLETSIQAQAFVSPSLLAVFGHSTKQSAIMYRLVTLMVNDGSERIPHMYSR